MSNSLAPAAYLRCYRQNQETETRYRKALQRFATCLGLPEPVIYADDGPPGAAPRPRLEQLTRSVIAGRHRVLLVPGLWVFSGDETKARTAVRMFTAAGCGRILQLPTRPVGFRHR
jgi:DNA invertase Pin-like site-specific DNA recombinase